MSDLLQINEETKLATLPTHDSGPVGSQVAVFHER